MSKTVNLVYTLKSDVEKGIDVFDLAPLLLSVGELIQEANKTIFPNGKELSVNIKPFQDGSFIIDIILAHKDLIQFALDTLLGSSNDIEDIKSLLKALGMIGGGVGVFQVAKFLKGKLPSLVEIKDNTFILFNFEKKKLAIDESVNKLYTNPRIGQEINRIGSIIQKNGIKEVESYAKGEEEMITKIEKKEAEYFENYTSGKTQEQEEEVIENELTIFLNPKRGSFEGEGNAWSFRRGGGSDEVINATIRDNDFLNKIKGNQVRLSHTDLLKVKILEKQKVIGNKVVSAKYEILKVIDYIKSPEQPTLDEKIN